MLNRERAEYCNCAQHRNSNIAVVFTSTRRENAEHAWPKEIRMRDLISFMPCSILTVSQSVSQSHTQTNAKIGLQTLHKFKKPYMSLQRGAILRESQI
jgi:hypothetical protein